MNKPTLIFVAFFLLILLSANVNAQPPFQTNTNGLEIAGVDFSAIKTDTSRTAVAFVYNATTSMPYTAPSLSCQFQVFSVADTGSLIFTNNTPTRISNAFYFGIPNTIYNKSTEYTRVIQCNTTNYGGFYKSSFIANPVGEEITTAKTLFYLGLLGLLIFFLCLMFWAHLQDQSTLARLWWFSFMWIPIWAILFIGWSMANDFLTSQGVIERVLWWAWLVIAIVYPFYLLVLVLYTFYWIYQQRDVQRLVKRGFSLEDAQNRIGGRNRGMAQ